jgi:hypothetical protein
MPLLADGNADGDEYAEVSKAAPLVAAQNSDNHDGDVKFQEVKKAECYALLGMRFLSTLCAESVIVHFIVVCNK